MSWANNAHWRRLVVVVLWLIAGVITNTVIAWIGTATISVAGSSEGVYQQRFAGWCCPPLSTWPKPNDVGGEDFAFVTKFWGGVATPAMMGRFSYMQTRFAVEGHAAGFPLRALYLSREVITNKPPIKPPTGQFFGLAFLIPVVLPIAIIWPGFLLNSLIYAIAVRWLVFTLNTWRKRESWRSSRLGCRRCGYNLVGLPSGAPCPECGTNVVYPRPP